MVRNKTGIVGNNSTVLRFVTGLLQWAFTEAIMFNETAVDVIFVIKFPQLSKPINFSTCIEKFAW
jgi:hypothetical protein